MKTKKTKDRKEPKITLKIKRKVSTWKVQDNKSGIDYKNVAQVLKESVLAKSVTNYSNAKRKKEVNAADKPLLRPYVPIHHQIAAFKDSSKKERKVEKKICTSENIKSSETSILSYLNEIGKVKSLSIQQVACGANLSNSEVIRALKSLNFLRILNTKVCICVDWEKVKKHGDEFKGNEESNCVIEASFLQASLKLLEKKRKKRKKLKKKVGVVIATIDLTHDEDDDTNGKKESEELPKRDNSTSNSNVSPNSEPQSKGESAGGNGTGNSSSSSSSSGTVSSVDGDYEYDMPSSVDSDDFDPFEDSFDLVEECLGEEISAQLSPQKGPGETMFSPEFISSPSCQSIPLSPVESYASSYCGQSPGQVVPFHQRSSSNSGENYFHPLEQYPSCRFSTPEPPIIPPTSCPNCTCSCHFHRFSNPGYTNSTNNGYTNSYPNSNCSSRYWDHGPRYYRQEVMYS